MSTTDTNYYDQFSRVSDIIKIAQASVLFIITLIVLIPAWISYFDPEGKKVSVEEFIKGDKASALTIIGKPLFEYSCKLEEHEKNGDLKNVLYYVPLVPANWSKEDEVKLILILDSGERGPDEEFKTAVKTLEQKVDSLKKTKGTIQLPVAYNKYDFFSTDDETTSCVKKKLSSKSDVEMLTFNRKGSMFGKIFGSVFALGLLVFIYVKVKQRKVVTLLSTFINGDHKVS